VARRNDLAFVREIVARLQAAGVVTWPFGGWAEELLGLSPAREHADLDLLCPAGDFALADAFLAGDGRVSEIAAKRFAHKRAFLADGVMVEIILVQRWPAGGYVTMFWGDTPYRWPGDVLSGAACGFRVASAAAVRGQWVLGRRDGDGRAVRSAS